MWPWVIGGVGYLGSSLINSGSAQQQQNKAIKINQEEAKINRQWQREERHFSQMYNAGEAEKQRIWAGDQAGLTRRYNSLEADRARQFNERMFGTEMGFNREQALANRRFQAEEAVKAREFSEQMSSTAYQRAMDDMRTAGLNPILAYKQGGASTPNVGIPSGSNASASGPSGPSARSSAPSGSSARTSFGRGGQANVIAATLQSKMLKDTFTKLATSAIDLRRLKKEVKKTDADVKFTEEATKTQRKLGSFHEANTAKALANAKLSMNDSILRELEMFPKREEGIYRQQKAKAKQSRPFYLWLDKMSDLINLGIGLKN